jgi:hypothetical protein
MNISFLATAGKGGDGGGGDGNGVQTPKAPMQLDDVAQQVPKKPFTGLRYSKGLPPPPVPPYLPKVLPWLVLMERLAKPGPDRPVIVSFGSKVAVSAGGSLRDVPPLE